MFWLNGVVRMCREGKIYWAKITEWLAIGNTSLTNPSLPALKGRISLKRRVSIGKNMSDQTAEDVEGEGGEAKKGPPMLIIIIAAVVLLAGGGAAAYFFLFSGGGDEVGEAQVAEVRPTYFLN